MREPTQTCQVCGDIEIVHPDGRGFPPTIARNRLARRCKAAGHVSQPSYQAGLVTKYLPDGTALGVVYEESEDWFRYECERCCYACSGSDQYRLELRADNHERDCNRRVA